MDNPERDLEERETGLELVLFSIIIVFYFSYAVHNITLLVLPSFSLSPFPFPSFSLPPSLSSPFFLLSSLPNHYPSSYSTALCNLDWFVWLLLTT